MKNLLLIHGWDYENYAHLQKDDAWKNRNKFLEELKNHYNVYTINLPGFGNCQEPESNRWNLDDYAKYVDDYIKDNNLKIDYLVGYSFGGAVSIRYKTNYEKIKLVLISPAIVRNVRENTKSFIKTPTFLKGLRNTIRDIYLSHYIKVPEMKYGTKFLKNTYQSIVREDLVCEIQKFNPNDITIIYGLLDTMVNPKLVINEVNEDFKKRIFTIKDGSHDIANTHTKETVELINDSIKR